MAGQIKVLFSIATSLTSDVEIGLARRETALFAGSVKVWTQKSDDADDENKATYPPRVGTFLFFTVFLYLV